MAMGTNPGQDKGHLMAYWIWIIVPPTLILIGGIGNVLNIIVLCRKKLRQHNSSLYLTCLAVSDLLYLLGPLSVVWMGNVLELDILALSKVGCKIHFMLVHLTKDISAWVLVILSIERVVAISIPFKFRTCCTRRKAHTVVTGTVCFLFLVNGHLLFTSSVRQVSVETNTNLSSKAPACQTADNPMGKIWPAVHVLKSTFIPGTIMLISSLVILWKIYQSALRSRTPTGTTEAAPSATRTVRPLSKLLLFLNLFFICTASPVFLYLAQSGKTTTLNLAAARDPFAAALLSVANINLVVNFWAYCFTGTKFRAELKAFFKEFRNSAYRRDRDSSGTA